MSRPGPSIALVIALCACGHSAPPAATLPPPATPRPPPAAAAAAAPSGWYCFETETYSRCERIEADCKDMLHTVAADAWYACKPAPSAWCTSYTDTVLGEVRASCSTTIDQCHHDMQFYGTADTAGSPRSVAGSIKPCVEVR